jgi:hypothetical protein
MRLSASRDAGPITYSRTLTMSQLVKYLNVLNAEIYLTTTAVSYRFSPQLVSAPAAFDGVSECRVHQRYHPYPCGRDPDGVDHVWRMSSQHRPRGFGLRHSPGIQRRRDLRLGQKRSAWYWEGRRRTCSFWAGRLDIVPGVPLELFESGYPGDKIFNKQAFIASPRASRAISVATCCANRLGCSSLRFWAEFFHVLNYHNFAIPPTAIRLF